MLSREHCWNFEEFVVGEKLDSFGVAGMSKSDPDLIRQVSFICKAFSVSVWCRVLFITGTFVISCIEIGTCLSY